VRPSLAPRNLPGSGPDMREQRRDAQQVYRCAGCEPEVRPDGRGAVFRGICVLDHAGNMIDAVPCVSRGISVRLICRGDQRGMPQAMR